MENNDKQLESVDSFETELAWCIQKLKNVTVEKNSKKCNFLYNLLAHEINLWHITLIGCQ